MANFEVIGYIRKNRSTSGGRALITVAEYVQGWRDENGELSGEKMDIWQVFFPPSSRKHTLRFQTGDLVSIKGTIHVGYGDYACAINGESIKHFYTRDISDESKREKACENEEKPPIDEWMKNDF